MSNKSSVDKIALKDEETITPSNTPVGASSPNHSSFIDPGVLLKSVIKINKSQ